VKKLDERTIFIELLSIQEKAKVMNLYNCCCRKLIGTISYLERERQRYRIMKKAATLHCFVMMIIIIVLNNKNRNEND